MDLNPNYGPASAGGKKSWAEHKNRTSLVVDLKTQLENMDEEMDEGFFQRLTDLKTVKSRRGISLNTGKSQ